MSERFSLEQLKAMSDEQLHQAWGNADFPFDGAAKCGNCLVHHWPLPGMPLCKEHPELTEQVGRFFPEPRFGADRIAILRANLDEFYALRLFFDYLYPQPAAEPQTELSKRVEADRELRAVEYGAGDEPVY